MSRSRKTFTKTALNAGIGRQSVDRGARIIARMTQIASPASQTRRPGPLLTVPVPGRITWIVPGRNGADMSALTTRPRVMEAAKAGLAAVTALGICLVTGCGSSGRAVQSPARPNPLTGIGTAGRVLAVKID